MKKIAAFLIFLCIGFAVNAQAKMELKSDMIDYGQIPYGGDGTRTFIFTNTGNEPLVISQVKSSCGCTVPTKPKEPIAPGETGKIDVKYDTSRQGPFRKIITVYSNSVENSTQPLRIKGEVLPKEK